MSFFRACFALVLTAAATAAAQQGMTTLDQLRDHSRPLLIFAAKPDDTQLEIQLRTLQEHAPAAQERDLIPIAVVFSNPSPTAAILTPADAETTRRRFGIAPSDFVVILIGKDGGEKLRSSKPLSMEKLIETIDAMPMRRDEMRRQP